MKIENVKKLEERLAELEKESSTIKKQMELMPKIGDIVLARSTDYKTAYIIKIVEFKDRMIYGDYLTFSKYGMDISIDLINGWTSKGGFPYSDYEFEYLFLK